MEDINIRIENRERGSGHFVPSLDDIQTPVRDVETRHIFFRNARALLKCIKLGGSKETECTLIRVEKRGVTHLRLIGSRQWVNGVGGQFNIFVAASALMTAEFGAGPTRDCV